MTLLRTLRIRNLVIIEDLTVEFGPGLNLLTGETGAGKSILVDALDLVAGSRADRSLVRAGAGKTTVEALFEIDRSSEPLEWLRERGVEVEDGQVVIRREISVDGPGRCFLCGSPCTLGTLRAVGERLLELHGQHDPHGLLVSDRHLELLDAFGGYAVDRERVRVAYDAVQESRGHLESLRARSAERSRRLEDLRETVRAIEDLQPRPGELDELARERRVLQNTGRIAELLDAVVSAAHEGEPSAAELGARAASHAEELAELDPSLAELARRIRGAALELEDAGAGFRDYRDGADFDPGRIEQVESRRAALERACLRFATDEAGLVELCGSAANELSTLESIDQELERAGAAVIEAEDAYLAAAGILTRRRSAAARKLEKAVERQFAALALEKAKYRVALEPASGPEARGSAASGHPLSPAGAERAEFLLAANPGEPMRPLRQVASGGELSRVMLALHVVGGSDSGGRVVVFDEVDAGVGGAVADAVGARLQRLAAGRQLLCITHLPQVAAYADQHFGVHKRVASGRTQAGVNTLSGPDRVEELARMLGGKRPTPTSRRHATELLRAAGRPARPRPRSSA